ncbi:hypothetical protein DNAM_250 [Pseudomonas phage BroderSalsa]|nr:hypothetical protein DNAM_250 [Pseudomonas phage BroderSalsa]
MAARKGVKQEIVDEALGTATPVTETNGDGDKARIQALEALLDQFQEKVPDFFYGKSWRDFL